MLPGALEAASKAGIPKNRIYLLSLPKEFTGQDIPKDYKTLDKLIEEGKSAPKLDDLRWEKGQGKRQTAFLCYSSGTSGLQVSISSPLSALKCADVRANSERGHDLAPQCHRKRSANLHI